MADDEAADIRVERVAGVDGTGGSWLAAVLSPASLTWAVTDAAGLGQLAADCVALAIDVPVGLAPTGRRASEERARQVLGIDRSSIFETPPQPAFAVARVQGCGRGSREAAQEAARRAGGVGISTQAWGLAGKILDIEDMIRGLPPGTARRVVECHPETSLRVMAPQAGAWGPKRFAAGAARRVRRLQAAFDAAGGGIDVLTGLADPALERVPTDDAVDALAAAWTARRVAAGRSRLLGADEGPPAVWSDGSPAPGRAVIHV